MSINEIVLTNDEFDKNLDLALWRSNAINSYLKKNNIKPVGFTTNLTNRLDHTVGIDILNSFFKNCIEADKNNNQILGKAILYRKAINKLSYLRKEIYTIIELNKGKEISKEKLNEISNLLKKTPITLNETLELELNFILLIHSFFNNELINCGVLIDNENQKILKGRFSYHAYMLITTGRTITKNQREIFKTLFGKQLELMELINTCFTELETKTKKEALKLIHWIPKDYNEAIETVNKLKLVLTEVKELNISTYEPNDVDNILE